MSLISASSANPCFPDSTPGLVTTWRNLLLTQPPFVLPADLEALGSHGQHHVVLSSYEEYLAECLDKPDDQRLHLGLVPQPYFGDVASADVFILMLNPGMHADAYFSEYSAPGYRVALIDNLRQNPGREFPLLFLDPQFAWTSGATYFRGRLEWIARALARLKGYSYREGLSEVARRVSILQLVPYHSTSFGIPSRLVDRLTSSAMARAFVHEALLPRSDALTIVTRQSTWWGLEERVDRVVCYSRSETRAAHLSPGSRGGRALAKHFGLMQRRRDPTLGAGGDGSGAKE